MRRTALFVVQRIDCFGYGATWSLRECADHYLNRDRVAPTQVYSTSRFTKKLHASMFMTTKDTINIVMEKSSVSPLTCGPSTIFLFPITLVRSRI